MNTIPRLNSGVRIRFDAVRAIHVLLGPERALMLDDIGNAIMGEVDGQRSITEISAALAEKFGAPLDMVEGDVQEFLTNLVRNRYVVIADGQMANQRKTGGESL